MQWSRPAGREDIWEDDAESPVKSEWQCWLPGGLVESEWLGDHLMGNLVQDIICLFTYLSVDQGRFKKRMDDNIDVTTSHYLEL